jgi:hypothetical protein
MAQRWNIRIGTRTTPRKKSAIDAAIEGRMQQRHYKYIQAKYLAALYNWLRDHLPKSFSPQDISDFAERCVNDAFVRIKEFEAKKKADPDYKFRSFLKGVVFKATQQEWRDKRPAFIDIEKHLAKNPFAHGFDTGLSNELAEEFVREALLTLKKEDEVSYEVFYRRFREELPYRDVYEQLKETYTLTITSEKACRQVYSRSIPKLKHIFRELTRGKYVDKDLPFNKYILKKLRQDTTKRK